MIFCVALPVKISVAWKGEQKMSIGYVGSILETQYQYLNSINRTISENRFKDTIQKAVENQQETGSETSKWAGDMIVPQPPNYSGFTYDSAISNKSKEEMTMDEYKQWFMNEMSKMHVSGWVRSTCVGGALVIKGETFEKMKKDPEWEKSVLNMIRKMYSVNGIPGSKMIGYQVIGATPEEYYGAGIPVKNNSDSLFSSNDEKSWCEERDEKHEELLEEQLKIAQKRAQEKKVLAQQTYIGRQLAIQQRLQKDYIQNLQNGNDMINIETLQTLGVNEETAIYEGTIHSLSENNIVINGGIKK